MADKKHTDSLHPEASFSFSSLQIVCIIIISFIFLYISCRIFFGAFGSYGAYHNIPSSINAVIENEMIAYFGYFIKMYVCVFLITLLLFWKKETRQKILALFIIPFLIASALTATFANGHVQNWQRLDGALSNFPHRTYSRSLRGGLFFERPDYTICFDIEDKTKLQTLQTLLVNLRQQGFTPQITLWEYNPISSTDIDNLEGLTNKQLDNVKIRFHNQDEHNPLGGIIILYNDDPNLCKNYLNATDY